jgi:truncated hemoglobin YjbI
MAAVMTLSMPVFAQQKGAKMAPLFERLGGKGAITAVVDEFVAPVAADAKINKYFAAAASDPARLASFKGKLVDQICAASGGLAPTRART